MIKISDNTTLNAGAGGDVIATDDITGVKHQKVKIEFGADGTATEVQDTSAGRLPVKVGEGPPSTVSTANSTTTTLGINGVFTGTGEDVKDYAIITILVKSDQASATDGLSLQYSSDNTNWDDTDVYTVAANTGKFFTVAPEGRYFRVVYTNGGTAQTFFRLQTIYHNRITKPSSHRINEILTNEHDAELVVAIVQGDIAEGVSDSSNSRPVKIGGRASTATPTAVNNGERVEAYLDDVGRQAVFDGNTSITVDGTVDVSDEATRSLGRVRLRNPGDTADLGDATNPVRTDPTGTTTQPVSDSNLDNATLVDNAAFTDGTTRVMVEGLVFDEVAGTALTENDIAAPRIDSKRAQVFVLEDETTRGVRARVTAANALRVDGSAVVQPVVGNAAHDTVDSGSPVKIGGKVLESVPTGINNLDRADAYFDKQARLVIREWGAGRWTQVHAPAANTRATTTKTAGGLGIRNVCTGLTVILAAGATAPTAVNLQVRVRDGISDTGTVLWEATISLPAVAGAMNGIARSGLSITGTANNAMTLEFSAAGGANTIESVSMEGITIEES